MAPQRIIIDTDPGVDDALALLLALSASEEELEVLLISVTFGNVEVERCLLNVVSMFHVLELERKWRIENDLPTGFGSLSKFKPTVAIGTDRPLEADDVFKADYFHGTDGLQGTHKSAPHFTPAQTWQHLFKSAPSLAEDMAAHPPNFIPTTTPAHEAMLQVLRENERDTVTIVALGPLANLALAAEADTEAFLRAKEVVVMGGTINVEGNITPVGEFNYVACPWSAARIYALTSPTPSSTLPLCRKMKPYPSPLSRRLNLTVFPLDITSTHILSESAFTSTVAPLAARGSPLAQWTSTFILATFSKLKRINPPEASGAFSMHMHDPMCVYYLLARHLPGWKSIERDIRVETTGQWTRGMCVVDRRPKFSEKDPAAPALDGDDDGWLHAALGNRVRQVLSSPDESAVARDLLGRVFGAGSAQEGGEHRNAGERAAGWDWREIEQKAFWYGAAIVGVGYSLWIWN